MEKKYFYCYSYPLKEELIKNGINPIMSSVHEKTQKKFWVFESGEDMSKILNEWRSRKPVK